MSMASSLIPETILSHISNQELEYIEFAFRRFGGAYPTLKEMWSLMDEVWRDMGCDPNLMDESIGAFYSHPVWLLNGLFIEQHEQSMLNRRYFTDWVVAQTPSRVADYGGGYGTLARMIGSACPQTKVDIIEPHPHPAAVELTEKTANIRYREKLTGEYDIIIATDVFEHVPDPLELVKQTAMMLSPDGQYLIANCFQPVILCHLPQTFHFNLTWKSALDAMGLVSKNPVSYGCVFGRSDILNIEGARKIESRSKQLYPWLRHLPNRLALPIAQMLV